MVKVSGGLATAGVLTAALAAFSWWRASGNASLTPAPGVGVSRAPELTLPRIALERLKRETPAQPSGERDVFRFGPPPTLPAPPQPVAVSAPSPVLPVDAATPPPPPTLPPFAVKYIGSVERQGLKVAILLSDDKKEVLTGREGDTVANRLRIVRIGIESVEVQDVGSERVRRIPLKGN